MAKPFSIQSPEDIAKQYGGNKQRIAEAMQMGVVDPTVGVLAGMFIDRMRGAQAQEGANPPTVAQQVMGGVPPTPPVPPSPAGGLGATPQAAPSMAPMAPPMPAPEGAPMGMADGGMVPPYASGGLDGIPVPDTMFDENRNGGFDDGYAGGGLVAFSDGGGIDAARLRAALRAQESGGDYGIMNREGSGAMGAYQFMPDTARALARRLGLDYLPNLMQGEGGRSKKGREYQERLMDAQMKDILAYADGDISRAGAYHFAGPNKEGHGPKTRQYGRDILRRYSGSKDDSGAYGIERGYTSTDPLEVPEASSLADVLAQLQGFAGTRSGDKTKAYLEAMQLTPDSRKEMKRMNEAAALAAAAEAFSGRGPFLGQLGSALAKASGTLAEGKKGIRAAELEGLKAGMTEEQQAYLDRLGILDPAAKIRSSEVDVRERALGRRGSADEAARSREFEAEQNRLQREASVAAAKIAAEGKASDAESYALLIYRQLKAANPTARDEDLQVKARAAAMEAINKLAIAKAEAVAKAGGFDPFGGRGNPNTQTAGGGQSSTGGVSYDQLP